MSIKMSDEEFMFKSLSHFKYGDLPELIKRQWVDIDQQGTYFIWRTFDMKVGSHTTTLIKGQQQVQL